MAGLRPENWEAKLTGILRSENVELGGGWSSVLVLLMEKLKPRVKKKLSQGHMAPVALEFWFAVLYSFCPPCPWNEYSSKYRLRFRRVHSELTDA